ncbi:MAG: hypothetical protein P8127_15960 [Acidobacteriota bacterium]
MQRAPARCLRRDLRIAVFGAALTFTIFAGPLYAQENEDCLMCHEDPELVGQKGDYEFSVFVDAEAFAASVHADFECIDCHGDLDGAELPHEEELEPVDCSMCHGGRVHQLSRNPRRIERGR